MARERFSGDDHREWLQRARSSLAQAGFEHPDVYLEDLCFQAQQAAEKALKGLILYHGGSFPYTHDIAQLLSIAEQFTGPTPEALADVAILSQFAVATRYPGVSEPVTQLEYEEAVALASAAVEWAEMQIREK